VRTLVPSLQAQCAGCGRDDGRTRIAPCAYDHHALGAAICPGVRKELGSLFTQSWPLLARRRDVPEGARAMGPSLPCRGQGGQYCGLPAESKERCCSGQGVLPQSAPHTRVCSPPHHSKWLCRIASRSARDAEPKRGMEAHQAEIIENT